MLTHDLCLVLQQILIQVLETDLRGPALHLFLVRISVGVDVVAVYEGILDELLVLEVDHFLDLGHRHLLSLGHSAQAIAPLQLGLVVSRVYVILDPNLLDCLEVHFLFMALPLVSLLVIFACFGIFNEL